MDRLDGTTVLLGRDAELSAIEQVLSAGVSGHGATLTVGGEAGIGKSTLLAAARSRAAGLGYAVLPATGSREDATEVHTVARQWFAPLVSASSRGTPPFDGPATALVDLVAGDDEGLSGDQSAMVLGCAWALEALRENGPVLLVVDDAQWVDEASRTLLAAVAARASELGVVLMSAVRTTEPVDTGDVALTLSRWDATAVSRRLSEHLGREVSEEPGLVLHATTGGVPFAVEESVTSLPAEASDEEVVAAFRARYARGMQRDVVDRIDDLSADARAVATAVAVIGPERAGLRSAAEVAQVPKGWIVALVDELTRFRILAAGQEPLRIIHPLVEQAIAETVGEATLSVFHARALDVLLEAGYHAVDLAGHARRAPARGRADVVEVLSRAAHDAVQRGAPATAVALLDRALREPPPPEQEVELLRRCATARIRSNDVAGGIEQYRVALSHLDDPAEQVEVLIELADALIFAGEPAESADAFERARAVLDEHGFTSRSPLRRKLLAHIAPNQALLNATWQQDIWTAVTTALADDPGQDTYADRLLYVTAALGVMFTSGSSQEALRLVRRGLDGTRLVREETADSTVLFAAAGVLVWSDQYAEDRVLMDAALADARLRGSVLGHATALYCRGCSWYLQGLPTRAVADLRAAVEAQSLGWSQYLGPAQGILLLGLLDLGEVEQARAELAAIDRSGTAGSLQGLYIAEAAGELALLDGDLERASTEILEAERLRSTLLPNPTGSDSWLRAIRLLRARGDEEAAREILRGVIPPGRNWGSSRVLGLIARAESWFVEDQDERRAAVERSVELLRRADSRVELVRSLLMLRELPAALEAAQLARSVGAAPLLALAESLVARLGGSTQTAAPSAQRLTPAELRVVELAVTGMTNRQIAAALFVTVKAVEWHLTRVYQKLEVTGRSQLRAVLDL